MKFSLFGFNIIISKNLPKDTVLFIPPPDEFGRIQAEKAVELLVGEVIPGYETFEGELASEEDSVEEREWREEQNWLNKRKQRDGTI